MNESSSPAPAPVSPLWTRDFTIITLGSVISMLGNSMSGFALSLLVLDYTGSNLLYAIYIATFTLPQIVMPIFSGAILDRFSRKKTIYTLDFLSSGVYLVAALILSRGWFSFPMLALFCFIIGSINSIYYVAYDSFYPLLISEGNYSKAYSIASVLETLSALIIPIATYFYNLFGIAPLLGINALCFFIAATAETQIRAEEHYIEKQRAALALEEQHSSGRQLLRDIKEGFRYLMSEKGLLRVAIYFTFSMLASGASQVITLPYFKSTFDNGEYIYMLVWGMAIFGRAIGGHPLSGQAARAAQVSHRADGLCRHLAVRGLLPLLPAAGDDGLMLLKRHSGRDELHHPHLRHAELRARREKGPLQRRVQHAQHRRQLHGQSARGRAGGVSPRARRADGLYARHGGRSGRRHRRRTQGRVRDL